ncbi:MAG TPA: ADP-heptose--LPS heptosyltransferase, partial [Acetobacteraceae bacterium]|nr:ADP-heptose--LPS heptosyltransferase [Acetobacteraceae bacterium]
MTAGRILIIRLGALGDFCNSFPAFAAIRAHHAADHVVLLTTPPFVALALESPWFDQVR